jgi:hypothetical protein
MLTVKWKPMRAFSGETYGYQALVPGQFNIHVEEADGGEWTWMLALWTETSDHGWCIEDTGRETTAEEAKAAALARLTGEE